MNKLPFYLIVLLFFISPVSATLIFEDNFIGGVNENWKVKSGSWAHNSTLDAYQTNQTAIENKLNLNYSIPDDNYIEFNITYVDTSILWFDLITRTTWYNSFQSGYSVAYVKYISDSDDWALFLTIWNGTSYSSSRMGDPDHILWSELDCCSSVTDLINHTIGISVANNTIKGYLDRTEILSTINANFSNGTAGIVGGVSGNLIFDDFKIYDTSPTINLQSPLNNTNSTDPYINFTYSIFDVFNISDISMCRLYLGESLPLNTIESTDTSITKNINQTFDLTVELGNFYWKVECNDTLNNYGNSSTYKLRIINNTYTEFTGNTTDFNNYPTPANITNATLEVPNKGKIIWLENTNTSYNQDFDENVNINHNYISVDSADLHPSFNSSTELTLNQITFINPGIKYSYNNIDWFFCNETTEPACHIISYENFQLKFNATHFTSFKAVRGTVLNWGVECLDINGSADTGCGNENATIISPNGNYYASTTFAEVSDTYFPGLWMGTWNVPATLEIGTAQLWIKMTNSDGLTAGIVLNFNVNHDYYATEGNATDLKDKLNAINDTIATQENITTLEIKLDEINITTHEINITTHNINETTFNIWQYLTNTTLWSDIWTFSIRVITDSAGVNNSDLLATQDNITLLENKLSAINDTMATQENITTLENKLDYINITVHEINITTHDINISAAEIWAYSTRTITDSAGVNNSDLLATQDNITLLENKLDEINATISAINMTRVRNLLDEINITTNDIEGNLTITIENKLDEINATMVTQENITTLKIKLDNINITVHEINITTHNINNTLAAGLPVNVTAISRCIWGIENPTVCGIWRTLHSWAT